jgi:hypothetical protein
VEDLDGAPAYKARLPADGSAATDGPCEARLADLVIRDAP